MHRYFVASFVTLFVYISLVASVIYLMQGDDAALESKEVSVRRVLTLSMVQPQMAKPKEHCEKKKIHETPEKKVVKKVIKKELEKIVKVKKELVEQKVVEQEIAIADEIEEDVQEQEISEAKESDEDAKRIQEQMQQMLVAKQQELDRFTLALVQKINENKRYPLSARRRGIEGDVDVKFTVMSNGNVDNIIVLAGKSIFEKATVAAIENSFPLDLQKSLLEFPKEFQIKLVYVLK